MSSPAARSRSQLASSPGGGQTSRPNLQNSGTAQDGWPGVGPLTISDGVLIIMVNGTIGNIMDSGSGCGCHHFHEPYRNNYISAVKGQLSLVGSVSH